MGGKYVKYKITPEEIPSGGIMFVDHEKNGHFSYTTAVSYF